jgi:hypothetical protein
VFTPLKSAVAAVNVILETKDVSSSSPTSDPTHPVLRHSGITKTNSRN